MLDLDHMSVSRPTQITQTLSSGNNTVTHNRGINAFDVTVLDSSGQKAEVDWNNVTVNSVNITLAAGSISNAVITIQTIE